MKCEYMRQPKEQEKANNSVMETVCGVMVQLVFADKKNCEVPEIVGRILKGSYLQRQSV